MRKFSYQSTQLVKILISQASGSLSILLFSAFAVVLISGIPIVRENSHSVSILNDPAVTLMCLAVWCLLVAWILGSFMINILPTIWFTETGLEISAFIIFRIPISWDDIIDIGAGRPPKGHVLVRTRKITPFHRVYGWFYSHSLYPSFLIGEGINDKDLLIQEIKRGIRKSD